LAQLDYYINTFKQYGDNIVIGITHIDDDLAKPTHQYRQWLLERQLNFPVFFIDARKKADVLLLLETLITALEIKYL
jgi:signal recognition particle receptor subunit beta